MAGHWQSRLNGALRRTAFGAVGGLFFLFGVGFLTAALWLALALAHGGVVASVIIGLGFCGMGLICLAFATKPAPPPSNTAARPDLVSAFLGGVNTGKAMARRPSAPR